jgi:DNA topoisomerase-1
MPRLPRRAPVLRGGRYGAFIACSNYPECKFTRKFAQPGGSQDGGEEGEIGKHPDTGLPIMRKAGRFGPYIQTGDGDDKKMASIPKDIGELTLDWAVKLLSLPRTVGASGNRRADHRQHRPLWPLSGAQRQIRPPAQHAEVFDTGMNMAVTKLAEAAAGGNRRAAAEPLKVFGAHPVNGGEIKLMAGRFGPYVTDGTTNATLPKAKDPAELTLEEAIVLIDERAAKGPAKGKKKAPPRRPRPKGRCKDG